MVSDTHAMVSDTHAMVSDTHAMVSDLHRSTLTVQGGTNGQHRSVSVAPIYLRQNTHNPLDSTQVSDPKYHVVCSLTLTSRILPGESPPPPPACFGRDELIEKVVGLAENSTPIALIGAGGIGKTSIALTLLHHGRIEKRFGQNRRFIRCDKFPATLPHFLRRLSDVIGAGVNNPGDLAPLRSFLSSEEMFIILDNAESILDPQGTNAQEIYAVVEELSRFRTISLCITSRITTVPQHCKCPIIPTLSAEAACNIFYDIYGDDDQSDIISNLLEQLDFHALSITLLATTASQNIWDHDRLAKEWDPQHTQILQTEYNESLATTIELSLTSPMFCQLGPDARDLLGVIAFFPQGVDMNNLDWLFPTTPNRQNIFDKFCALSLTYQSTTFITMLAPLRDYLCPKDPKSSPLLCTAKNHYFSRLSVDLDPGKPGFEEAKWVMSEDVNIEHLLDVFTSADANSDDVWDACASFVEHLRHHKPRLVMLGPKLEGLPDKQPSKPKCLFQLALLVQSVGNDVEAKQLLIHTLELWRGQGNNFEVAQTLEALADTNKMLGCSTEGIQQAEESLEIFKQLNDTSGQADCLRQLALLLWRDNQLDAAEKIAFQLINLLLDKDEQPRICQCYDLLGDIRCSKGEIEEAINHYKTALGIASSLNWHRQQFRILYALAAAFFDQGRFDDAHAHVRLAKTHTLGNLYLLGLAMEQQAEFWYEEGRLEEAKSEVLSAAGAYEKVGAAKDVEDCVVLLQKIEGK
jgi:tetratricopeptide (TPR) repeat protein